MSVKTKMDSWAERSCQLVLDTSKMTPEEVAEAIVRL